MPKIKGMVHPTLSQMPLIKTENASADAESLRRLSGDLQTLSFLSVALLHLREASALSNSAKLVTETALQSALLVTESRLLNTVGQVGTLENGSSVLRLIMSCDVRYNVRTHRIDIVTRAVEPQKKYRRRK